MKVAYLDQHLLSKLVQTDRGSNCHEQLVELRQVLESTAARRSIVYPFSSIHVEETSNADREHGTRIIDLLERLSCGYAFQPPKQISPRVSLGLNPWRLILGKPIVATL